MGNHQPATPLPTNRHFDCMKKCPMDCTKACKRIAYPRLVERLSHLLAFHAYAINGSKGGAVGVANTEHAFNSARALLRELGEEA